MGLFRRLNIAPSVVMLVFGRGPAAAYRVCAGKPSDPGASEISAGYGSRA